MTDWNASKINWHVAKLLLSLLILHVTKRSKYIYIDLNSIDVSYRNWCKISLKTNKKTKKTKHIHDLSKHSFSFSTFKLEIIEWKYLSDEWMLKLQRKKGKLLFSPPVCCLSIFWACPKWITLGFLCPSWFLSGDRWFRELCSYRLVGICFLSL